MKKAVGIVLLEYIPVEGGSQGAAPVYKISQMKNTVEWSIGQTLTRQDVLSIIKRVKPDPVDVIVKSLEFEGS